MLPDSLLQNTQRNRYLCLHASRHALLFGICFGVLYISRGWDDFAEHNSSGNCSFICPLHPFQSCWWCCIFWLQSPYALACHISIISNRFSYSAENQLGSSQSEELKAFPRMLPHHCNLRTCNSKGFDFILCFWTLCLLSLSHFMQCSSEEGTYWSACWPWDWKSFIFCHPA